MSNYIQTCSICGKDFSTRVKGTMIINYRFRTWRAGMKAWKKKFGSTLPTRKRIYLCSFCVRHNPELITKLLLDTIETKSEIVDL